MVDLNVEDSPAPLPLSDDEKRILELHDRLQQLQLEIALLNAQRNYVPDTTSERSIEAVQKELLDSRSRYVLRNDVVDSVMSANPILQAVHNGTNASPIERDLLPLLAQRDTASSGLAQQAGALRGVQDEAASVSSHAQRLGRENAALAARLLELAGASRRGRADALAAAGGPGGAEVAALEAEVAQGRRRWRVLKGAAGAVVTGSGVDWARDPALRDMVLDAEGEGDGHGDGEV